MSIGSTQPFWPSGTLALAATTTSANGTLVGAGEAVLIYNSTSAVAFVQFGSDLTVAASATASMPVPAGARMLVHCGEYTQTAAVILSAGSGSVYLTRGNGTVY